VSLWRPLEQGELAAVLVQFHPDLVRQIVALGVYAICSLVGIDAEMTQIGA